MDSPARDRTILVIQSELVNETRSLNLVECARFIIQGSQPGHTLLFGLITDNLISCRVSPEYKVVQYDFTPAMKGFLYAVC